jgi:poly-gamma-glutamate capsule biosynthesis protein CapA/YwtB (metallophosphatase superfamily)
VVLGSIPSQWLVEVHTGVMRILTGMVGVRRRLRVVPLGVAFLLAAVGAATAQDAPSEPAAAAAAIAAVPNPDPVVAKTARLLFGGDVLIHQSVLRLACTPKNPNLQNQKCNFAPLLAPTKTLVSGADLAVCHLEVPLIRRGQRASGYPTFGTPPSLAAALAETGWDHCSTASNHSIDRGLAGVDSTLEALDAAGITHAGTARTVEEAREVDVREVNGIRVAFLSATYGLNGLRLPKGQGWRVRRIDVRWILAAASAAKAAGVPIVIVSLHWGNEYQHQPTAQQRNIARTLMESGNVDLIVGHHAHVVQPIERVNGRWVVFGMGNHVSGQTPVGQRVDTQHGVLVEVAVTQLPDGTATVGVPVIHPTWNDTRTKRVYLTANLPNLKAARASEALTRKIAAPRG